MSLKISVVSPMFNEELCIEAFISSLMNILAKENYDYEIILVDDGSKDRTFDIAKSLAKNNSRIKIIKFSRNFGHQMALFAGLKYADGDYIIMMDSDLQHPPELIPSLIEKAKSGAEIVQTVRRKTHKESHGKKLTSKFFYWLINKLSYTPIIAGATDFRLVSKKANKVFCGLSEYDRFNRGLFSWIGFNSEIVEYDANDRYAGKSNYTFQKMMSLALSSITSFSNKPLRLSLYLGMGTLGILGIYLVYVCYNFFVNQTVKGWSSLFFSITMIGSVQLISIGLLGEYIYRIYNEVKGRPHYIVEDVISDK